MELWESLGAHSALRRIVPLELRRVIRARMGSTRMVMYVLHVLVLVQPAVEAVRVHAHRVQRGST